MTHQPTAFTPDALAAGGPCPDHVLEDFEVRTTGDDLCANFHFEVTEDGALGDPTEYWAKLLWADFGAVRLGRDLVAAALGSKALLDDLEAYAANDYRGSV